MRAPPSALALVAAAAIALAGCSPAGQEPTPGAGSAPSEEPTPTSAPTSEPTSEPTGAPTAEPAAARYGRVSLPALAEADIRGDRLQIGAVREQTPDFTSYDVTFRSRLADGRALSGRQALTISGVLNVPTGPGPFPAVVLAHGYIPPEIYVPGQGMTRERGALATAGYVTLHVDYRGHAGSDPDPAAFRDLRLGYVADVVAAGHALRGTTDVPIDDARIALMGRSMGGGVAMKAAVVEPDLFGAVSLWASVSSLDAETWEHFQRGLVPPDEDPARVHGTPAGNPRFWRGVSARPFLGEIAAPVELVHGRVDEVCPPRWAPATLRAMRAAGVDARLRWYDDLHAFGPAFTPAMSTTIAFLDRQLGLDR